MQLDNHVPIPKNENSATTDANFILINAEVGNSVLLKKEHANKVYAYLRVRSSRAPKYEGMKFMLKTFGEYARIWRVA